MNLSQPSDRLTSSRSPSSLGAPVAEDRPNPLGDEHRVCSAADVPDGGRVLATVAGLRIGIFNRGGRYFALHDRCPHQGAPLCRGELTGVLEAVGPGFDFRWSRDGDFVRCPWHGWEFEIESGRSLTNARVRARTYAVVVRGGEVFVRLGARGA